MKKKIFFSFLIILVAIGGVVAYLIFKDLDQETALQKEINEVFSLFDDFDQINSYKINDKLDKIVTKGDYAVVEASFKAYIHDYFYDLNILKIIETVKDERNFSGLSINNYKTDGPDFINTKEYLEQTISFLENSIEKYEEYTSEDKIMSYIADKDLNNYYIDLYRNDVIGKEGQFDAEFVNNIESIIKILRSTNEIINLLSSNKDKWYIENDQIVFSSEAVMNDYNALFANFNS